MDSKDRSYKIVLLAVLELLKEQGLSGAGEVEGLNAYQALSEALTQAEAFGLSPSDIGLGGFDPDTLLNKPRKAA